MSRDTITAPSTVRWGETLPTEAVTSKASPWLHAEVFQNDVLVYAQYVKGAAGSFTVGPTPAADESQPGSGRVEVGYWTRQGTYRATAVQKIEVTA